MSGFRSKCFPSFTFLKQRLCYTFCAWASIVSKMETLRGLSGLRITPHNPHCQWFGSDMWPLSSPSLSPRVSSLPPPARDCKQKQNPYYKSLPKDTREIYHKVVHNVWGSVWAAVKVDTKEVCQHVSCSCIIWHWILNLFTIWVLKYSFLERLGVMWEIYETI